MTQKMQDSCLELALEGERLCRIGEVQLGVQYLESAVKVGTSDTKALSAIYSQLGNAYFILQEYSKSLDYHTLDLNLSITTRDRQEEAKASGNIGNTLKVLGKYDEAFACCQRHLDIARELNDQVNESKALYNLGNVFHLKGKQIGKTEHKDPGDFPKEAKESLETAIRFYEANLELVKKLNDKASIGRTCGNLGNTHYLLGNFNKAIQHHEQRLKIAEDFGDKSAERRACNNLGNAYMFLGDFQTATKLYKKTLDLAREMKDRTLEAQACYSLGNTYTLLREFQLAIEYHVMHLKIAQELRDRAGEGRACWSLSNVYSATKQPAVAMQYAKEHLEISKEIDDMTGYAMAQMNISELKSIAHDDPSAFKRANSCREKTDNSKEEDSSSVDSRSRRKSLEALEVVPSTPDKVKSLFKTPDISLWKRQFKSINKSNNSSKKMKNLKKQISADSEDENFFDLLSKFQSRRIDDQRCSCDVLVGNRMLPSNQSLSSDVDEEDKENYIGSVGSRHIGSQDDFFEMLAGIQGSRMNDQRAELSHHRNLLSIGKLNSPSHSVASCGTTSSSDEHFFEMLIKYQSARLDSQRTTMPQNSRPRAPTVPDDDFLNLIQRFQGNRLDEQRTFLPSARCLESQNNNK